MDKKDLLRVVKNWEEAIDSAINATEQRATIRSV